MFINAIKLDELSPTQRKLLLALNNRLIDGLRTLAHDLLDSDEARNLDPCLTLDLIMPWLERDWSDAYDFKTHLLSAE